MTPTPEQQIIVEAARGTKDNLLISALAGAAKTTTLELISKALFQPTLCLAFNKKIAVEMEKRLPGHVKSQTMNSVGHRVWQSTCSKKLSLDTRKTYSILKGLVDDLKRGAKTEAYETFSDTLKLIGAAKTAGYIPDGVYSHAKRLISCEDFWSLQDEDVEETSRALVDACLSESIRQAYQGTIDFDDQIYMPTLFGGTFPRFPLVLVDEAQDLSPLNHSMLEKLVTGRLIAVGDERQSIYAFRGAVTSGMEYLRNRFTMTQLTLSVSFRCPKAIVLRAREHAPHMQWAKWAEEGQVNAPTEWSSSLIPDGAAIICRNNAPLFRVAFQLIRSGRGVTVVGSDIGPALIKALKKLGPETLTNEQLHSAIFAWEAEALRKAKNRATVKDKSECLRVFADVGGTLGGAVAYAESIFKSQGPIQLLSGHKAKGLEWDHVFHLDPDRIPSPYAVSSEEVEQELNIGYVILTRAKRTYTEISTEGYLE